MLRKSIVLAFTMACVATAAADPIEAAKATVLKKLKDPESARFRDVRSVGEHGAAGEVICGEVNAKNSFGGYVGFKAFYFGTKPGNLAVIPGGQAMTDNIGDSVAAPADRYCGPKN